MNYEEFKTLMKMTPETKFNVESDSTDSEEELKK